MSACHRSRDGTHHPMAQSQHSPGVILMSCMDAVELWHVRLRADGILQCRGAPSPPHLRPGDGWVHGARVLVASP